MNRPLKPNLQQNPSPLLKKKADPAFKEKALSEYIKQYGNAECAKKEIDGALKDCNEDMDCIHNKINQNCNL